MFNELKKKMGMLSPEEEQTDLASQIGKPSEAGMNELAGDIKGEQLGQMLSLDTEDPNIDAAEAARRQGVKDDSMDNAVGMIGGIAKVKDPMAVVAGIQSKLALGQRLNAAEEFALQKARRMAGTSKGTHAVVEQIQPNQRFQDLIKSWQNTYKNGGK